MQPITVLVADDDPIVRDGLTALLEGQPDLDVVGEAADGQEAVDLALELRPQVLLTDIGMPRLDGIEATRLIKRQAPSTAVIFLTVFGTHLTEALAAGGSRYLLKGCPVDELLGAIRDCADSPAPSIMATG